MVVHLRVHGLVPIDVTLVLAEHSVKTVTSFIPNSKKTR